MIIFNKLALCLTIWILFASNLHSQNVEPQALGPFTGFATETDFNNPDRILWGYNWGGTNSRLNRLLGFNYFHGGDSFECVNHQLRRL